MNKDKFITGFLIGLGLSIPFIHRQNNHIEITKYDYYTDKISDKSKGYRILQVSDLHNKQFGKNNYKILEVAEAYRPNAIFLTGDTLDNNYDNYDATLMFLRKLIGIADVFYITGNHENHMSKKNLKKFKEKLLENHVKIIDNDYYMVNDEICILGVDDLNRNDYTLGKMIDRIDSDMLTIALEHRPHLLKHYANQGPDIVFTGHAHGGQWRVPFTDIAAYAPDQGIFPKYTSGEHKYKDTTMYISKGLGGPEIPSRLFDYPELVIVDIHKK